MSKVNFTLNGKTVYARVNESILDVCKRLDINVPHLCYHPKQRVDGNCRACMVEITGERTLAPSCKRKVIKGMDVKTQSSRAKTAQKGILQMLSSTLGEKPYTINDELKVWQTKIDQEDIRSANVSFNQDTTHPAIDFHPDACILCTRCVRACREVQVNNVIGMAHRGSQARIVFDLNDDLGESQCVGCGECVQACPTGALSNKAGIDLLKVDKTVDSVCPYCGVGCLLRYHVKNNKIIRVEGRDGPANLQKLCIKGRYGFDYVHHPERLTKPLIRRDDIPKGLNDYFDPANPLKMFREASWDEALDFAANSLLDLREQYGLKTLAGFGSAKCSNEEAYLFQKLVRVGFGNNNVDHCTRLCHASSVAALLEGLGSGAVSNPVEDVKYADVILVIGSNTTGNHPVAATFIKQAKLAGKTLIVIDPREITLAQHADYFLQFSPDSDVALLNALLHTVIEENLIDKEFIAARSHNFEEIKTNVAQYSAESVASICDIPAEKIRQVARVYAGAKNAMIFWGMGVSQHIHGTDNVRCLISLSVLCGQIGRKGAGLHPLRGQNNVQGASDAGLIPMMYPDYQRVDNAKNHARFEQAWNADLDTAPGLTVVQIMHAMAVGEIKGLYVMGENPAMSDPNLNVTRAALANAEHLVVQDIFLTETAAFADVVLPAAAWAEKSGTVTNTDRRVQMGRAAISPPGDAKPDHWITGQIGQRMGCQGFGSSVPEVYEEMRQLMPSIAGISWERLEQQESVTYPCKNEDDIGQQVVFTEQFSTPDGKAKLVPVRLVYADEKPDDDYPLVLITGRRLEHWHTGSMTRRAQILNAIEPCPVIDVHPDDLAKFALTAGDKIIVQSRRGEITVNVCATKSMRLGEVFLPFCYVEAAANLLTNDALDPLGKIPEFKYCAVRFSKTILD